MAKDPAFLFYPADASEDTQFLNRLERGCYFDLLKAQKKYRKFSLDLIKKVLGQDFVQCWPAVESVLKKDGQLYFIEWADTAIENRAEYSAKQKKRIEEYWQKKKQSESIPEVNHGTTTEQLKQNQRTSLEDESAIENEIVIEIKDSIKKESAKNDSRETKTDFTSPDVEGDELIFPLDTKPMRELWERWKKYRWEKYQARYGFMGEQADLKRLERMSFNQIEATILAAISNGWKNLYPEQNRNEGNGKSTNKKQQHTTNVFQGIADYYGPKLGGNSGKPNG